MTGALNTRDRHNQGESTDEMVFCAVGFCGRRGPAAAGGHQFPVERLCGQCCRVGVHFVPRRDRGAVCADARFAAAVAVPVRACTSALVGMDRRPAGGRARLPRDRAGRELGRGRDGRPYHNGTDDGLAHPGPLRPGRVCPAPHQSRARPGDGAAPGWGVPDTI